MKFELSLSRREVIAERLANGQPVVAAALAAEFEVSEDAIRRDLRALASEGRARRVYGGALPFSKPVPPISTRMSQSAQRKQNLAYAAAQTIKPGEVIFLDSGSTNVALAGLIPSDKGLMIATNSVDVAHVILGRGTFPMIMIGGVVNVSVGGSVDGAALAAIENMNFDRAFVGGCAISPAGISVQDHAESLFKRVVMKNARQRVVLATSEKFRETAPFKVCLPTDVDCLVIEADLDDEEKSILVAAGYPLKAAAKLGVG
ncbi:DeoR/GlpR family DNA-binding transcription regulator [Rhizobium sp. 11515TR]|uniref:DeoR/GlpR family DNA-binding transcription regulator n=1 Tax=Rhizobium sp. 11515TR TaxID=2028343 RepID=UPI000BA8C367|nr:DeoR/GlpR family DNA-binding transcription regulator [Rhizobium sp. 11515TR]ASW09915.1 DeoR family transcriptional regulator [Rhizobium sp. 11515TR]